MFRDLSRFWSSINLTGIFPGKHLIQFLAKKIHKFRNYVVDNCILIFDAEQVYLKLQVTKFTNKEVTAKPKPQTLEKLVFLKPLNPEPYTRNPKHQIHPKASKLKPKPTSKVSALNAQP